VWRVHRVRIERRASQPASDIDIAYLKSLIVLSWQLASSSGIWLLENHALYCSDVMALPFETVV